MPMLFEGGAGVGMVNSCHDFHSIASAEFLFRCFTLWLALGASAVSLASFADVASRAWLLAVMINYRAIWRTCGLVPLIFAERAKEFDLPWHVFLERY